MAPLPAARPRPAALNQGPGTASPLAGHSAKRWAPAQRAALCVPQVLEVVMDVGRPPLARFPGGDVRLSEAVITYADLDTAVAKVRPHMYSSLRACVSAFAEGRALQQMRAGPGQEWPAAGDWQSPASMLVCVCAWRYGLSWPTSWLAWVSCHEVCASCSA